MLIVSLLSVLFSAYSATGSVIRKSASQSAETMWKFSDHLDETELTLPPKLNLSEVPDEQLVYTAGLEVVLECEAAGIPTPVITWFYDDQPISGLPETTVFEKMQNVGKPTIQHTVARSRLRIPCISQTTAGNYKCVTTNGKFTREHTSTVSVGGDAQCVKTPQPPTIRMWTDGRFENEGNTAQLMCRATRGAHIAWYDESRRLLNNHEGFEVLPSGDLVIRNIQFADHMGTYTCVASNEYGEDRIYSFLYPTALESTEES